MDDLSVTRWWHQAQRRSRKVTVRIDEHHCRRQLVW